MTRTIRLTAAQALVRWLSLQQNEDFDDGTVSANDGFRPVSRYFDRSTPT